MPALPVGPFKPAKAVRFDPPMVMTETGKVSGVTASVTVTERVDQEKAMWPEALKKRLTAN